MPKRKRRDDPWTVRKRPRKFKMKAPVSGCPLIETLPIEIRQKIFAYAVASDCTIHVKRVNHYDTGDEHDEISIFQLHLCSLHIGHDFALCKCTEAVSPSNSLDNAIFLLSQQIRREALDTFFAGNRFVFDRLYDVRSFTQQFKTSSSKIQRILVIHEHWSDDHNSEAQESYQATRQRLQNLGEFEIFSSISPESKFMAIDEDALVRSLIAFGMWPAQGIDGARAPSKLSSFTAHVRKFDPVGHRPKYWKRITVSIKNHLEDVFTDNGVKYKQLSGVAPLMHTKPKRYRHIEPNLSKRGMLLMGD